LQNQSGTFTGSRCEYRDQQRQIDRFMKIALQTGVFIDAKADIL
jgi:hypothetical protein